MENKNKSKMSRSERLRLIAFRNVQERKKLSENERAKIQAFKNVKERNELK